MSTSSLLPAPCLLYAAKYLAEVRKEKERRELEKEKQVQKEARARAMSSCVASSSESSSEDSRLQSDSDSRQGLQEVAMLKKLSRKRPGLRSRLHCSSES